MEAPDLNVEVPEGQIEGELPEGDINVKGPKWKLKGPHFKGPNIKGPSFSLPRFKGKGGQGEVSVGDVDIVQELVLTSRVSLFPDSKAKEDKEKSVLVTLTLYRSPTEERSN